MKSKIAPMALFVACGLVAVAPATSGPTDAKNSYPKQSQTTTCNGDTLTLYGAKKLWPPNHKYRTYTVTAHESHPTGILGYTLKTTATSNQPDDALGDGHTVMDANPPAAEAPGSSTVDAQTTHMLRAERSGTDQAGRTYTITADADFDGGANSCHASWDIVVPHDMRPSNR